MKTSPGSATAGPAGSATTRQFAARESSTTIRGHSARGAYWGLSISRAPNGDPMEVEAGLAAGWRIEGQVGPADDHEASWMSGREARALIASIFERWRKGEFPLGRPAAAVRLYDSNKCHERRRARVPRNRAGARARQLRKKNVPGGPEGPPGAFSPSEVPVSPAAAQEELPRPGLPLVKVRCSSEYCYANDSRGCWVPRLPPRPQPFPAVPCGISSSAVHLRLAPKASSSRELSASSRVLRPATCPPRLEIVLRPHSTGERLPWGPVPHRGISQRRPPLPRESRPQGHVPSAPFLTASRVCSATNLRGLVSSRSHVQGLPFRGLSLSAEPYRVSPAVSCPRVG